MSDLVERVQAFTDSTRERWSGSEMSMATALLEEVITALSAPMPDDVAKSVNWLQGLCDIHNAGKVVYMLERLQTQVAALEEENTRLGAVLDSLPADIQTLFGGAAADEFVKSCSEYPRNRAALKQEVPADSDSFIDKYFFFKR